MLGKHSTKRFMLSPGFKKYMYYRKEAVYSEKLMLLEERD
jgi:hypothetical protein